MPSIRTFRRLDLRPLLARGEPPLAHVEQRVDALRPGEGLIVIAPFLPSPMIEIMKSQGIQSRVEPGNRGVWIVYLWRQAEH